MAQAPIGQVPGLMGCKHGRPTFESAPFPGQAYAPSFAPAYATTSTLPVSSPMQKGQIRVSQPAQQSNVRPGGASPPGQPPYYGY